MAKLLGFELQRIRFVYFVGRSSIFFACVSISVAWVLLLTVKCGKVKLVFYLRVLVLTYSNKTPLQNSPCLSYSSTVVPKCHFFRQSSISWPAVNKNDNAKL